MQGECSVTVLRSWAGCADATGLSCPSVMALSDTGKWDSKCQACCWENSSACASSIGDKAGLGLVVPFCACPHLPRDPVTAGSGSHHTVSPPQPPAALLVQPSGGPVALGLSGVYVLLWAITNEPELLSLPKTGSGQFPLGKFPAYPLGRLWFILVSGPPQSVSFCTLLVFLMPHFGIAPILAYFGIAPFCSFSSCLSFVHSFVLGEYKIHWCWMGEASRVLVFFLHHWG